MPREALCWSCVRARPQECAWIDRLEPVWRKAQVRAVKDDTRPPAILRLVVQCDQYQRAEGAVG